MGEIRVKVTLSNGIDEMLEKAGQLKRRGGVRKYVGEAVVDTGAVRCVIPQFVFDKLGIGSRGERVASYADGRNETVPITGPILFDLYGRDTVEEAFVLGDDILIGQTVLEKLDLVADSRDRSLYPNPARPNQPVNKIRRKHEGFVS
jgi:predicted aspartyl protease